MKKTLIFCAALWCIILSTYADDCRKLGYKGFVTSAVSSRGMVARFYSDGTIQSLTLPEVEDSEGNEVSDMTSNSNGFSGTWDGKKLIVKTTDSHITSYSFTFKNNNEKTCIRVVSFTYGEDGFPEKLTETTSWSEKKYVRHESSTTTEPGDRAAYNKFMAAARLAADKGDVVGAKKYHAKAQAALKSTKRTVGKDIYKDMEHKSTRTLEYYNYRVDGHGNWISRNIDIYDGDRLLDTVTETQEIEYDDDFLREAAWETLKDERDWDKIAEFANSDKVSEEYRTIAAKFWNDNMDDYITDHQTGARQELLAIAKNPIATDEVKEEALKFVRQDIFYNVIQPMTDQAEVKKYLNEWYWDDNYKKLVKSHYKTLKYNQVQDLVKKMGNAKDIGNFKEAAAYAEQGLKIDPEGEYYDFKPFHASADFENLKQKVANKTVEYSDYTDFLDRNPNSNYDGLVKEMLAQSEFQALIDKEETGFIQESDYDDFLKRVPENKLTYEVKNKRALFAADQFDKNTTETEFNRVRNLDMGSETKSTVEKIIRHWKFVQNRGSFVHVGLAFDYAYGPHVHEFSPGIGIRLGWNRSLLNGYVGAQYSMFMPTRSFQSKNVWNDQVRNYGGYLKTSRLTIPVMLRLNFVHKYDKSVYFAAGLNLNLPLIARFSWNNIHNGESAWSANDTGLTSKFSIAPRAALGYAGRHFEFEVFGVYETKETYDRNYLNMHNIWQYVDDSYVDQQISSRWRVGCALRILFGK